MVSLFVRSFLHFGVEVVPQLAQNLPSCPPIVAFLRLLLRSAGARDRLFDSFRFPFSALVDLNAREFSANFSGNIGMRHFQKFPLLFHCTREKR